MVFELVWPQAGHAGFGLRSCREDRGAGVRSRAELPVLNASWALLPGLDCLSNPSSN